MVFTVDHRLGVQRRGRRKVPEFGEDIAVRTLDAMHIHKLFIDMKIYVSYRNFSGRGVYKYKALLSRPYPALRNSSGARRTGPLRSQRRSLSNALNSFM